MASFLAVQALRQEASVMQAEICGETAGQGVGRWRVTEFGNVWAQRSGMTQKREGFCAGQVGQNAHRPDQADDFFK